MAGIVFFKTRKLEKLREFYISLLGMKVWLEQQDCLILMHDNLLLGFCEREPCEEAGIITLFYRSREEVNTMYNKLRQWSSTEPLENKKYSIYQFFAKDPENRTLEFQCFLHPIAPYLSGEELLLTRRSIRNFKQTAVTDETLRQIFEICRYAPTSKNSQSYYFLVIRDPKKLQFFASLRGGKTAPIAHASTAVAICSDSTKTSRPQQDGCIAAYHFIVAAWLYGLGTCWIAAMDRNEVKELLGIPLDHYVATITPLGYPATIPQAPSRREAMEMVRFVDR